ncbi:hypothetical protein V494_00605, partial [Pseudogymnoascus sp. VKM F-4513 (FW-928)]
MLLSYSAPQRRLIRITPRLVAFLLPKHPSPSAELDLKLARPPIDTHNGYDERWVAGHGTGGRRG